MKKILYASTFKRIIAFCLDNILLSTIIFLLCLSSSSLNIILNKHNDFIYYVLAAFYFSLLNSSFGNGQTFGKFLLGLKVVKVDGELLDFGKSFLRYLILFILFFQNVNIPYDILSNFVKTLIFSTFLISVYLLLFNKQTKQSLHDIVVGSIVINKKVVEQENEERKIWPVHYFISVFLVLISCFLTTHFITPDNPKKMIDVSSEIEKLSFVQKADVIEEEKIFCSYGSSRKVRYILSEVVLNQDFDDDMIDNLERSITDIIIKKGKHYKAEEMRFKFEFTRKYGVFMSSVHEHEIVRTI